MGVEPFPGFCIALRDPAQSVESSGAVAVNATPKRYENQLSPCIMPCDPFLDCSRALLSCY